MGYTLFATYRGFSASFPSGTDTFRNHTFRGTHTFLNALASDDIAKGRLVVPFAIELPLEYGYYVIRLEGLNDHPHSEALREWLPEEATSGEGNETTPKK